MTKQNNNSVGRQEPDSESSGSSQPQVTRIERLGGLPKSYHHEAA